MNRECAWEWVVFPLIFVLHKLFILCFFVSLLLCWVYSTHEMFVWVSTILGSYANDIDSFGKTMFCIQNKALIFDTDTLFNNVILLISNLIIGWCILGYMLYRFILHVFALYLCFYLAHFYLLLLLSILLLLLL